jgi:hypothetical protein
VQSTAATIDAMAGFMEEMLGATGTIATDGT